MVQDKAKPGSRVLTENTATTGHVGAPTENQDEPVATNQPLAINDGEQQDRSPQSPAKRPGDDSLSDRRTPPKRPKVHPNDTTSIISVPSHLPEDQKLEHCRKAFDLIEADIKRSKKERQISLAVAERSAALIRDDQLGILRVHSYVHSYYVPMAELELEEIAWKINELKRQRWEITYLGLDPLMDGQREEWVVDASGARRRTY